jgi:phage-related baseplate assembly protein
MSGLPLLPDVTFAELSPVEVENAVITTYERIAEKTLYPGDPVRLFLESLAYLISMQNAAIDLAGRQNLLAFADGPHLDHLGALMDTPRLPPAPAVTSIRFSLAEPLGWAVLIPQGSRVTTGSGGLVFATDRTAEIAAGKVFVDVPATCAEAGQKGNGLVPGQISKMVDPLPVKSVANVSTSILGADEETDEPYRERIQLAPERFSVAGPSEAYRWHALAAHQDIAACAVFSPVPGVVDVRPVLAGGELPPEDLLAVVRDHLNDERVRPLTDTVIVAAPEPVEYAVEGGWHLQRSNAPLAESIKARVAAAVEEYRVWQRSIPGRDINPTRLIALMERAGAKRVEIYSPVFIPLEDKQIARETSVNVEFLGIESE